MIKLTKKKVLLGIIIIIVLGFVLFSRHGIINRYSLEMQKSELIDNIRKEKMINDSLKKVQSILQNDYYEIERIARERYGMIKPGEKIFIIKDSQKK